MPYFKSVLCSISQFINALFGGLPDETLCSRMWRHKVDGSLFASFAVVVLNRIFFFDPNHCKDSYDAEVEERHVDPAVKAAQRLTKQS